MVWNEEQRELRRGLAHWGEALSAKHLEWDERAEFPRSKWGSVRECGVLRLPFPRAHGGLEQDLPTTMYVLEELGYRCEDGGLNFAITTHMIGVGVPLLRFGTDEQRARYLSGVVEGDRLCGHAITEPDSGSDAFAMRTTAVRDGDCYVLNGRKTFTSNGPAGDLFVVYAMTNKQAGALGGVSAFLVPRDAPGFAAGPPIKKMGLRSAPMCDLVFEDCRIPAANLIAREGMGFAILDHVMKWEILCSFIVSVGEMQRRLEKCLGYAKTRKQFGQAIGSFQAIAHKLVDMRIGVEVSREALYRAGHKVQLNENATVDVAIAKLLASEHNRSSALEAIQIFGGYGYMTEYGLEKELRNAVAGTIYSGTSETQRNRIARMMGL
jgi:alkylation response protein AidB-like acyl-CoA dehydrogenase